MQNRVFSFGWCRFSPAIACLVKNLQKSVDQSADFCKSIYGNSHINLRKFAPKSIDFSLRKSISLLYPLARLDIVKLTKKENEYDMLLGRFYRFGLIIIVMILINVVSPPQIAESAPNTLELSVVQRLGLTDAELEDFQDAVDMRELTGRSLDRAVQTAQKDIKLQTAIEHLQSKGFVTSNESVLGAEIRARTGKEKRHFVVLVLDYQSPNKNIARLLYISDSQGDVRVGFGFIEQQGDARVIRTYEVQENNEILEEPAIRIRADGTLVTHHNGQEYTWTNLCEQGQGTSMTSASDCFTCQRVCSDIWNFGCGLSGVLTCTLVCAPIGTISCPLICGGVFILVCLIGGYNCNGICGPVMGYCP